MSISCRVETKESSVTENRGKKQEWSHLFNKTNQ